MLRKEEYHIGTNNKNNVLMRKPLPVQINLGITQTAYHETTRDTDEATPICVHYLILLLNSSKVYQETTRDIHMATLTCVPMAKRLFTCFSICRTSSTSCSGVNPSAPIRMCVKKQKKINNTHVPRMHV